MMGDKRMNQIDIYFSDLTPEAQQSVLELFRIRTPEEVNWDIFPIFQLDGPDD